MRLKYFKELKTFTSNLSLSLPKKEQGDTLIEVLLCIAIVGAAIAGSYALASSSLQAGVSASERTEASKLAEGQIEALKIREKGSTPETWCLYFTGTGDCAGGVRANNFCLDLSAVTEVNGAGNVDDRWKPQNNTGGNPNNLVRQNTSPSTPGYKASCTSPITGNGKYFVNIITQAPSADPTNITYLVTVRWLPAGGGPTNQTQMYYRVGNSSTLGGSPSPGPPSSPPAASLTFTAVPDAINYNTTTTLSWISTGLTSCVGSSSPHNAVWVAAVASQGVNGSQALQLTTTTSFVLTCTGPSGSINRNVNVTVCPPPPPGPGPPPFCL